MFLPTSEAIVYTDTNVYEVYAGTPGRDHEKDGTVLVLIYSRANPLDTKSILIPAPKQGQGALTATEIRDTTIDLTQAGTTEHLSLDLMTLTIAPGTQS